MSRYHDRDKNTRYDGDQHDNARLYVGNLSSITRSHDLERLFSRYGRVVHVDLKKEFAFVEFSDIRNADDARHYLNGRDVDGRHITVEFVEEIPLGPGDVKESVGVYPPPEPGLCFNCGLDGLWPRNCKDGDRYRFDERGPIERNFHNSAQMLRHGESSKPSPVKGHFPYRRRSNRGRSVSRSRSPGKRERIDRREKLPWPRSTVHERYRGRHYLNGRDVDERHITVEFAKEIHRGSGGVKESMGGCLPPGPGRCFNCGLDGHRAQDCDRKNKCSEKLRHGESSKSSPIRARSLYCGISNRRSTSRSRSYAKIEQIVDHREKLPLPRSTVHERYSQPHLKARNRCLTRLYVGHLSSTTRSPDLEHLFGRYGRLLDIDLKKEFAFVEFSDPLNADEARHYLNGRDVDGHRILVEFAKEIPRGPGGVKESMGDGPSAGPGRCFNCGNDGHLTPNCKDGNRKNMCYQCGERGHIQRNCPRRSRVSSKTSKVRARSPNRGGSSPGRSVRRRVSSKTSSVRARSPNRGGSSPGRSVSLSRSPVKREGSIGVRQKWPRSSVHARYSPPPLKATNRSPTPDAEVHYGESGSPSLKEDSNPVYDEDNQLTLSECAFGRPDCYCERYSPPPRGKRRNPESPTGNSRSPESPTENSRSPGPKEDKSLVYDKQDNQPSPGGSESLFTYHCC